VYFIGGSPYRTNWGHPGGEGGATARGGGAPAVGVPGADVRGGGVIHARVAGRAPAASADKNDDVIIIMVRGDDIAMAAPPGRGLARALEAVPHEGRATVGPGVAAADELQRAVALAEQRQVR
jgi:hypothetical protein